ncbi:MAG: type II secretion system protein GspN [Candidatus Lambdaproteobacteria bacterium RIFOXYD1_FULL_56_27]|nr:MAG: type II secretion system protein GspN [Candidatus Lambdaproteobacteria bacterium RIFOXYC1_FULL_56_13]OGH07312.1 MAG: type II secretion system protein GspN [Candidatus Lambdaproteobacteria bacterium RIFOXYD1_FULL_56_27]
MARFNLNLKQAGWVCLGLWLFAEAFWLSLDGHWAAAWVQGRLAPLAAPMGLKVEGVETRLFGFKVAQLEVSDPLLSSLGTVQNLELSFAPWNLLLGRIGIAAELFQGELKGYGNWVTGFVSLEGQGVRINLSPWLRGKGVILSNPALEVRLETQVWGRPQGSFGVKLVDLTLGGNGAQLGLDLPSTRLDSVETQLKWAGEQWEVAGVTQGDLNLQLGGTVLLNPNRPFGSVLNLRLTGMVKPEYEQALGFLSSLLEGYKNPQGRISVELTGTVSQPELKRI